MSAASILHTAALSQTYVPKRKITLIRDTVVKSKRRILLMREPFKENDVKMEKRGNDALRERSLLNRFRPFRKRSRWFMSLFWRKKWRFFQ